MFTNYNKMEQSITESEDTFGLEFAAIQWLNLVTNAEHLFNSLLHSILLTSDEKEQIQRWLCLKQECEECVASDEATSFGEHHRRSLEKIDELTEDTEQTEDLSDGNGKSTDSQYESDTESDFDAHHPDFEDKLDRYMELFRDKTDMLIRSKLSRDENIEDISESLNRSAAYNASSSYQNGRRKSIHMGNMPIPISLLESSKKEKELEESENNGSALRDYGNFPYFTHEDSPTLLEPSREFENLLFNLETKKKQIHQISLNLDDTHKRIDESHQKIRSMEGLIEDFNQNKPVRSAVKKKCNLKKKKIETEYFETRIQLNKAEDSLQEGYRISSHEVCQKKKEMDVLKKKAKKYEKKINNIVMMQQLTGDNPETVLELKNLISKSKDEIEMYKNQIRRYEDLKRKLKDEILEIEEKIKINKRGSKKGMENSEEDKLKWIVEETEKLGMRDSPQKMKKAKSSSSKSLEKSMEKDEKTHRQEIKNLRKAKDSIIEQKSSLDNKYHRNTELSPTEERKLLEHDETIEAIDTVIEYKNELICGRKSIDSSSEKKRRQRGEQMLLDKIYKLSIDEMRMLLYKYFHKVIDLIDGGRKRDRQMVSLENERDNLMSVILKLRNDFEYQKVAMQRQYYENLHRVFRCFADESGSSSAESTNYLVVAKDDETSKLKRENKHLRERLSKLEALVHAAAATRGVMRIRSRSASPETRPLKQLPALPSTSTSTSAATSKLRREKNKVFIRLNASKK